MKISQIMRKAYVIDENVTLKEAAKIMSDKKIGGLIVIKNNKISGIITERNIINNLKDLNAKVSKYMSKNVISISPNENVETAARLMTQNKIKRIPVVDNGKLIGLVRITDVVGKSKDVDEGDFIFN
ncbi:MAG: CBS domain-containing protein [Candidatus Pacearchaeota archaeon]